MAFIQGIETVIALCLPESTLWVTEELVDNAGIVSRLRLFYSNAGAMAFASGLALVILAYLVIKEEIVWYHVVGMAIVTVDLFLSYGIGGIACALVGIIAMLAMTFVHNISKHSSIRTTQ